jgi:hypothetical protein
MPPLIDSRQTRMSAPPNQECRHSSIRDRQECLPHRIRNAAIHRFETDKNFCPTGSGMPPLIDSMADINLCPHRTERSSRKDGHALYRRRGFLPATSLRDPHRLAALSDDPGGVESPGQEPPQQPRNRRAQQMNLRRSASRPQGNSRSKPPGWRPTRGAIAWWCWM